MYLSSDGGHTWAEVLSGPHVFEIGDHGGIILAASSKQLIQLLRKFKFNYFFKFAKDLNKTSIIKYSWDEGATWAEYDMKKSFYVEAIATEPSNMEQRFIVYGKASNNSTDDSVVVMIDLT